MAMELQQGGGVAEHRVLWVERNGNNGNTSSQLTAEASRLQFSQGRAESPDMPYFAQDSN